MPCASHDREDLIAHGSDTEVVGILEIHLLVEGRREPVLSINMLHQLLLVEATHVRLFYGHLF